LSNGNARRRVFLKTGAAAVTGLLAGCERPAAPAGSPTPAGPYPAPPAPVPSPLPAVPVPERLWNLSELAPPPDWERLEAWQETITAGGFRHLVEDILTEGTAFWSTVEQRPDRALIRRSTTRPDFPRFELRFAPEPAAAAGSGAVAALPAGPVGAPGTAVGHSGRYWRKAVEMGPPPSPERALEGVRIALDPGHIGGAWAKMEGRWYQMGEAPPVMEGGLTLKTAQILRPLLEAMGAKVTLVRETNEPLTSQKPEALLREARESLLVSQGPAAILTEPQILREAERLFYRTSEIRTRGQRVNEVLQPDLVVCLHFNAESWGSDSGKPVFSTANHLHVIAHGCLDPAEFSCDDQRLDALLRGLQGIPEEEIRLCDAVARQLALTTGLPPYTYTGRNARKANDNPYLWLRNLLANRVYHCPVVFTEPYVMNNEEVFGRIQAGDYPGEREIAGKLHRSLFQEYAQGVANGLQEAMLAARR